MPTIDATQGILATIWREDPCALLYEFAKRNPGGNLGLRVGSDIFLVVQDAVTAHHILRRNPDNYTKNFGAFEALFGRSRLTSDGPTWQRLQKLTQPLIARTAPESVRAAAARHFASAADEILARRDGHGHVLVDDSLDLAAAKVICDTALGFDVADLGTHALDDFRVVLQCASRATWNIEGLDPVHDLRARAEADIAMARVSDAIHALVRNARTRPPSAEGLLSVLMEESAQDVDLVGEICSLLFAGFDTSASTLGWCLFLLAIRPDLQGELRKAVRSDAAVIDDPKGPLVAFVEEALRIFPPVPILSRIAVSSEVAGAAPVAAGLKILISVIGLHHDRKVFPAPSEVDLQRNRTTPANRELVPNFLPFSLGKRGCPGAKVAMAELPTALAVLIDRLAISLPDQSPLRFAWSPSLRRRDGQTLRIEHAA